METKKWQEGTTKNIRRFFHHVQWQFHTSCAPTRESIQKPVNCTWIFLSLANCDQTSCYTLRVLLPPTRANVTKCKVRRHCGPLTWSTTTNPHREIIIVKSDNTAPKTGWSCTVLPNHTSHFVVLFDLWHRCALWKFRATVCNCRAFD